MIASMPILCPVCAKFGADSDRFKQLSVLFHSPLEDETVSFSERCIAFQWVIFLVPSIGVKCRMHRGEA